MKLRSLFALVLAGLMVSGASAQYAFWTRGIPFSVELGREGWIRPTAGLSAPGFRSSVTLDFSALRLKDDGLRGAVRFVGNRQALRGLRLDIVGVSETRTDGERALPNARSTPVLLGDATPTRPTIALGNVLIRPLSFDKTTKTIVVRGVLSGWVVEPSVRTWAAPEATCFNEGPNDGFWLGHRVLNADTGDTSPPLGTETLVANSLSTSYWVVGPDGRARLLSDGEESTVATLGPVRRQRQVRSDANGFLVAATDDGLVHLVRRDGTEAWRTDLGRSGAILLAAGAKGRIYAVRQSGTVAELVAIEDNGKTVRVVTTSQASGPFRFQSPTAIGADPIGYIHVLDRCGPGFELRVFDPFGGVVRSTRQTASKDSADETPVDLAFSPDGRTRVLFRDARNTLFVRTYRPF